MISDQIVHVIFVAFCSLIYGLIMCLIKCRSMNFKDKIKGFLLYAVIFVVIYTIITFVRYIMCF